MKNLPSKMTRADFIRRSKSQFGDRFHYLHVTDGILTPDSEIILCCPDHGDFVTTVRHHLESPATGGCHRCRAAQGNAIRTRKRKRVTDNVRSDWNKLQYENNINVNQN